MSKTMFINNTYFPTSHSLTSIQVVDNKKIDPIILSLQSRKKQLMEILANKNGQISSLKDKETLKQTQQINKLKQQKNWVAENENRKKKYQTKIEKQTEQHQAIKKSIQQLDKSMINYVQQREECEVRLRKISDDVGLKYRKAFGFDHENCQNSRKWIYWQIFNLQQQIVNYQLNLRKVICKLYAEENKILISQPIKTPPEYIIQYIIKMKLVNKLYGIILDRKIFQDKKNNDSSFVSTVRDQSLSQNSSIQNQYQEISETSKLIQNSHVNDQYEEAAQCQEWYDVWVSILKLMKILEKMQPIQTSIQSMHQNTSSPLEVGIDIKKYKKQIKDLIQQSKRIKKIIKELNIKIQEKIKRRQEFVQQLSIKEEFIQQMKKRLAKLSEDAVRKSQIQNSCQFSSSVNVGKQIGTQNKQLKQVQEAIRYFMIKKSTSSLNKDLEKFSESHIKSFDNFSTTFLSPQKDISIKQKCCGSNLRSTAKKTMKNKYSLKDLLSPSKNYSTLDKKQAWK